MLFAAAAATGLLWGGCRVALDIGHDPYKPGARSSTGRAEYQFNRRAALATYRHLKDKGIDAFFINSEEDAITLAERSRRAEQYGGDLFVSFHHDSVQKSYLVPWSTPQGKQGVYCDRFSGYSVFVSRKNKSFHESLALAKHIGGKMRAFGINPCHYHALPIKHENRALLDTLTNVYAFDNLVVLKRTKLPAVLIELGMIVNRKEEQSLWSTERLDLEAEAISEGVEAYCMEKGAKR
jgi:N-acetylmuramoyl-L-alanine amidase